MTRTLIRPAGRVVACAPRSRTIKCARFGARLRLAIGPAERALKELAE